MERGEVFHIGGHKVMFPFKPYPTQLDMMSKILRGLDKRQNCLLESPTGSGKTLALLCSSLAWQQTEYAKLNSEIDEQKNYVPCEACQESESETLLNSNNNNHHKEEQKKNNNNPCCVQEVTNDDTSNETFAAVPTYHMNNICPDDDEDFVDLDHHLKLRRSNQKTKLSHPHVTIAYEMPDQHQHTHPSCSTTNNTLNTSPWKKPVSTTDKKECTCQCNENKGGRKKKVPIIFFGSRTHKQLKQVIKELKQSQYKNVKMSVLASRDLMCINQRVKNMASITEGCKNLLETDFCHFHHKLKKFCKQSDIQNAGLTEAWDIEDLLKVCSKKSISACPYFLSRSLLSQSDIIFCPYNYFIDPIIRQNVGIELSENIVIVDEAHNIEGSCREATSFSITKTAFINLKKEIIKLLTYNQNLREYNILLNLAQQFISLIDTYSNQLNQKDFNQSCKIWSGFDIVAQMVNIDIGPKDYNFILNNFKKLCADIEKRKEKKNKFISSLSSTSFSVLEQLFIILGFFYANDLKNAEDFRMAIVKSISTFQVSEPVKKKSHKTTQLQLPTQEFTLHLWCMNPGVAFGDFHGTHSVILTSGTLSPMISFQSELQMPFQISMEGRHVITPSQVWIGSLGSGPSGKQLKATYKIAETYMFQDELGSLVLDVCLKVPNGVLCFLSSYTFLDKLTKRWQTTGVWEKILKRKAIIAEPRSGKKEVFEKIWMQFLQHADGQFPSEDETKFDDNHENNNDSEDVIKDLRDGALFLAVCRGKLSEGTDFANNSARAVITVGIPYPYVNDVQIGLKKEYNEMHKSSRHLLSGSEWFEIQAYRALNQALGRCIRHKDDWGAIILVDDRFLHGEKYVKGLSKWVRAMLKPHYNYYAAMKSLEHFARKKSNGDNVNHVDSEQSILDTTLTKNNSEQSFKDMTAMNVNTLKNLCSNTPGPSGLHIQPLITSTPLNNKNKCSSITESEKTADLLPVTINGISVIPKNLESFIDKIETDQSECSIVFPIDSEFNSIISDTPRSLKKSNNARENLKFEKDHLNCMALEKTYCKSEPTVKPVDETSVELELTNTQLVDETLKSEVLLTETDLVPTSESDCEKVIETELNNKPDSNHLHQTDSQSSSSLFSNSDSDILSIDECYLEELSKTVVAKGSLSKKHVPNSSGCDNDLLSCIENEADCTSSKPEFSVYTIAETSDNDTELLSFVESEAENLSAFTTDKSKPLAALPDVDMNDEDLLSFVENEESSNALLKIAAPKNKSKEEYQKGAQSKKENASNSDTRQLLPRRPLFKTSCKPSHSISNQMSICNVRTAPKKSGCEDVYFNEFEPDFKESEEDSDYLKTKRFTNRKKRHCTGGINAPRKKVKSIVFEPPEEENSEVICQTCQETLLTVHQSIARKPKVPPFLMNIFAKNLRSTEIFFLDTLKSSCEGLDHLVPITSSDNGVALNSAWFPDLACCVQYLQCPKCPAIKARNPVPPIIGAKVVIGTNEYSTGQVWLSGSTVKISHPH